jgi:hypothetical protein
MRWLIVVNFLSWLALTVLAWKLVTQIKRADRREHAWQLNANSVSIDIELALKRNEQTEKRRADDLMIVDGLRRDLDQTNQLLGSAAAQLNANTTMIARHDRVHQAFAVHSPLFKKVKGSVEKREAAAAKAERELRAATAYVAEHTLGHGGTIEPQGHELIGEELPE